MSLDDPVLATLRPEVEVLLTCARTELDADRRARLRTLVQRGLHWELLIRAAHRGGTLSLLYWHLSTACPAAVPPAVLAQLRDHFQCNARRNLTLTDELLKLLRLLDTHGLGAIPIKGPVLAASLYGNLALREFGDLDLLLHKDDIPKARALLVSQGYRPTFELASGPDVFFFQSNHHYALRSNHSGTLVELHWALTPTYFSAMVDPESLWTRLDHLPLGGVTIPTLSPEDLLLSLCVHGAKHLWCRLGWICDIAELIRAHPAIDWPLVLQQATRCGSERMLLLGLFLAGSLLATPVPPHVWQRVQAGPTVRSLAAQVREWLLHECSPYPGLLETAVFFTRARERLPDGIRAGLGFLTVPTVGDLQCVSLPPALAALYFVIRPLRLMGQYGRRRWCRFTRQGDLKQVPILAAGHRAES